MNLTSEERVGHNVHVFMNRTVIWTMWIPRDFTSDHLKHHSEVKSNRSRHRYVTINEILYALRNKSKT